MFGLTAFFSAIARLTASINTSAELFDAANAHLRKQLAIDTPAELPALPAPEEPANGRRRKVAAE